MRCNQCNSEILASSKFCPECGYKFPELKMTEVTTPEDENKETYRDIGGPKARKWGWGWYILAGLYWTGQEKYYAGEQYNWLKLIGIASCIIIYFYFRNKVFVEKPINRRSFYSGVLAYISAGAIVSVLVFFVPKTSVELTKKINTETNKMRTFLLDFVRKDSVISGSLISNPKTKNELLHNIEIIDKATDLYKAKDSVVLTTYNSIYLILKRAEDQFPTDLKGYKLKSEGIISIINGYKKFVAGYYDCSDKLKLYYQARLNGEKNQDDLLDQYLEANENLESLGTKLKSINKDLNYF